MKKYLLFGAGRDGKDILKRLQKDSIYGFIDNFNTGFINGIPIYKLTDIRNINDYVVIITSSKFKNEIAQQLREYGVNDFLIYNEKMFTKGFDTRLSKDEWAKIYSKDILDEIFNKINLENWTIQTKEMLKLTNIGDKVLEIGTGSGETSIVLSQNKRKVTALDYSKSSIDLVKELAKRFGCSINAVKYDAFSALPFTEQEFDVIFQAGLLEHFDKKTRIELLKNWGYNCKKMVSLIPNAHSVAYRVGKYLQETAGTWEYGLEMPQSSLRDEFIQAGFVNIKEYTIGTFESLNFLPENHYLKIALKQLFEDNCLDTEDFGQGYLLVTIGEKI